MLIYSNHLF